MKLLCRWRQHRLAQEIVAGKTLPSQSVLCLHLAQCEECCLAYDQLRRLHGELAQSVLLPVASAGFASSVRMEIFARAQARQNPSLPKTVFAVVGFAATLLCVFALRSVRQHSQPQFLASSPVTASNPKEETKRSSPIVPPRTSVQKASIVRGRQMAYRTNNPMTQRPNTPPRYRSMSHIASVQWHKPYRRYHAAAWKPKLQSPIAPIITPEIRSQQWAQWASYYETHGDYTHAADAYAHAYSTLPTEGTAFAAGEAAENAGDVSQAILYYSQILRQPLKQKPQTEKGTFLWNSERDAA